MPRSPHLPFSFAAALLACSNEPPPEPVDEVVGRLEIFATTPDGSIWDTRRSFAVGIQSELRVADERRQEPGVRSVTCIDGCTVRTRASAAMRGAQLFLVTPTTPDFHVHVELEPRPQTSASFDRVVHALRADVVALHPGPGPGVPFVEGMRIVWYLGLRAKDVAWEAERAMVSVSAPFELVGRPFAALEDGDPFVRVEIRAPLSDRVEEGTVELHTDAVEAFFPLVSVPRSDIAALHVAPAPDSPIEQRGAPELPLEGIVTDWLDAPIARSRNAWLVFETKSGVLGIAGTGECLPSSESVSLFDLSSYDGSLPAFDFRMSQEDGAPSDWPLLRLEGKKRGTGRLLLVLGHVNGSAQVVVSEEAP